MEPSSAITTDLGLQINHRVSEHVKSAILFSHERHISMFSPFSVEIHDRTVTCSFSRTRIPLMSPLLKGVKIHHKLTFSITLTGEDPLGFGFAHFVSPPLDIVNTVGVRKLSTGQTSSTPPGVCETLREKLAETKRMGGEGGEGEGS